MRLRCGRSKKQRKHIRKGGFLPREIIPVSIPSRKGDPQIFDKDEFMKPATTWRPKLKPAFRKDGTVTAGNASGLNDGAAALLIASDEALKVHSLTPMARIVSSAAVGVMPGTFMDTGLLKRQIKRFVWPAFGRILT